MVNDLEDRLQNENQAQAKGQTEGGLEKEVKKSWGEAVSELSAWDWTKIAGLGVAGAMFGGGLLGFGALNLATTTASYVFAHYLVHRKKGFKKEDIQTEFLLGIAITPVIYHLFQVLDGITNPIAYAATFAAVIWPFTVTVDAMKYLINKYSPSKFVKGIFKLEPFKDVSYIAKQSVTTWFKDGMKATLIFAPLMTGLHYLVPIDYIVASVVPVRVSYRYWLERRELKREEKQAGQAVLNSQPDNVVPMPGQPKSAPQTYMPQERAA